MKMFQSNIYYFMSIKVYIVYVEKSMEFYLCLWILSLSTEFYLCMQLLGACIWKRLGAKYAVVGCKVHNG